tara:strand:- start:2534 stop:3196 length:663 start_codon:yes stop_codon:yes gene_type:complete
MVRPTHYFITGPLTDPAADAYTPPPDKSLFPGCTVPHGYMRQGLFESYRQIDDLLYHFLINETRPIVSVDDTWTINCPTAHIQPAKNQFTPNDINLIQHNRTYDNENKSAYYARFISPPLTNRFDNTTEYLKALDTFDHPHPPEDEHYYLVFITLDARQNLLWNVNKPIKQHKLSISGDKQIHSIYYLNLNAVTNQYTKMLAYPQFAHPRTTALADGICL